MLKIKDVSEANVVTLYLFPEVNEALAPMLKKTLKPGARIVSHDFLIGDWKPDKQIDVKDAGGDLHDAVFVDDQVIRGEPGASATGVKCEPGQTPVADAPGSPAR